MLLEVASKRLTRSVLSMECWGLFKPLTYSSEFMSDLVHVHGLHLRTIIGINPDERVNRQDVVINLSVSCDCREAAASDSIEHAVNYRTISKRVIELVEHSEFFLVEKMAEEIAKLCLADPRAEQARVEVLKPGAVRFADSVGVEVVRDKSAYDAAALESGAAKIDAAMDART